MSLFTAARAVAMSQTAADNLASSLLQQSGRHCAVIAVPHCGSGELVQSFWTQAGNSKLIIDAFESDPALLASAQQAANALKLLGRNLYVRSGTLSTNAYSLPYADHFCDLVAIAGLTDADLNKISYAEVERVIATGAKAWIGRATAEGGGLSAATLTNWITGAGTRALSSASVVSDANGIWAVITKINRLPDTYEGPRNPNSNGYFYNDKRASWPSLPQWFVKPFGEPHYPGGAKLINRSVGGGRLYGSPYTGLSAYRLNNGQLLWQRADLNDGGKPFSRGTVCGTRIIDGETGDPKLDQTIPVPGGAVIWCATENDIFYTVVTNGTVNTLFAYNLTNGATVYCQPNFADNKRLISSINAAESYVVMANGKIYTRDATSTSVYGYNALDGSKAWGPVTVSGADNMRASSIGVLLLCGDGLHFLSAVDGSQKWGPITFTLDSFKHFEIAQSASTNFNGGREFISGIRNSQVLDLLTGQPVAGTSCGRGVMACGSGGSITPRGAWNGGAGGCEYSFDYRANCQDATPFFQACDNILFIAGGMALWQIKGCPGCHSSILGEKAEVPMGDFNPDQPAVVTNPATGETDRLEKGPVYDSLSIKVTTDNLDWLTHRANNSRSAYSPAKLVTDQCIQLWKYTNSTPNVYSAPPDDELYVYQDVTPPVTAGGYTYLAGSDGIVKCLENATGSNVWNFVTGGWVFATPTIANGCVYVGSGDGYTYCLEAHTGKLVWRFRATPAERRFNYYGHLISAWPILTGVLVHTNGWAYFVSGMIDQYGVQAYAVDARTGALKWQNTQAGVYKDNRPGIARTGLNPAGYMTVVGPNLWVKESAGGRGVGIFNLQDGTMSSAVNTTWQGQTGRQIAAMGNYVIGWGEELHTEMNEMYKNNNGLSLFMPTDAAGSPIRQGIVFLRDRFGAGFLHSLAWDNTDVYLESKKYAQSDLIQCLNANIQNPNLPSQPGAWGPAPIGGISRGEALTPDYLIQINSNGTIGVMDRVHGWRQATVSSGGEPYVQGLAVDRSGKIIVANRNGDVICFGTTNTVIVRQPTNVSGAAVGDSVSFCVEAAGLACNGALTYQWRFNGVNIAGATHATYAFTASDSNTGSYDVLITNGNGTSVPSTAAALALAVSATVTAPASGAVFGEPANFTISADATSIHGAITNVMFYQGATWLGSTTSAPYSFTWTNVAAGTYSLTAQAYDDQGMTGVSLPVNVTVAGLVTHLTFDEGSGTVAHDSSGHSNHGFLTNCASWTTQSAFNGGVHFNGWTNAVTVGPVRALTNSAITVGFWLNSDLPLPAFDSETVFTFKDAVTSYHASFAAAGYPSRGCNLAWCTTAGTQVTAGPNPLAQGVWYHYAIVATPAKVDWYINGSLYATLLPPNGQTMMTAYQNFIVGNNVDLGNPWVSTAFKGIADELKIYDRALTASEIMNMVTNVPYRIPPGISLINPTNNTVITSTNCVTMTVNTTVTNGPLRVVYYYDGTLIGTSFTAPYSLTWSNAPRGTYSITAVAMDGLNQTATSTPVTVTFAPVAQPTSSLAGGTYATAQSVIISCADPLALIYYTTNGVDPTTSDTLIASGSSIMVNGITVLKVRAFRSGFYPSEIQTVIYRIGGGLATSEFNSTILKPDGSIWTWGQDQYWQMGVGSAQHPQYSYPIPMLSLSNVISIADGTMQGLAVKADGTVWSWGDDTYGELGNNPIASQNAPVQVAGLTGAISVSAGSSIGAAPYSLALKLDGSVWAWGNNSAGQLGDGTTSQRNTPVQVGGLTGAISISAGALHSLALKSDGTVWAWGQNAYGQLGNGTTNNNCTPVQVIGLSNVVAITGGYFHSLAVKSDGTVWAWGQNANGQLGDGTTNNNCTPVQVNGLGSVVAIAGGYSHSLALKSDGTVWAWGYNGLGQLGDGTRTQRPMPIQVFGLSNVVAIAGGYLQSLALKSDGTVWGFGYNNYYALGNGTSDTATLPTIIPETVQFNVASQSVLGSAGTATITAMLWVPSLQDVIVPYTTNGSSAVLGMDYSTIARASPLVIKAGQTTTNLIVTLPNNATYRGSQSLVVNMATPTNAIRGIRTSHTVTITSAAPMPTVQFTTASQSVTESGTATNTILLSQASGLTAAWSYNIIDGTAIHGVDYTYPGGSSSGSNYQNPGVTNWSLAVPIIHRPGYQSNRTFQVTISGPSGCTLGFNTNQTVTITDMDPQSVSITTQPLDQTVIWGQPATFGVTAMGTTPTYQWMKNGVNISGAIGASYTTTPTVVADNGSTFRVIVSNAANCVTSSVANLTVICNPPPSVSIANPVDGVTVTPPSDLTILAKASSIGTIAKVELFNNGTHLLGVATSYPYNLTFSSIASGAYNLTAIATDNQAQTATSAVVRVTVSGAYYPPLAITTASLSSGVVGVAYNQGVIASGGTPGYTWNIISNGLPGGLGLVVNCGTITGTPITASTTNFTVCVTDAVGSNVCRVFSLTTLNAYNFWCLQQLGTTNAFTGNLLATPANDGIANLTKYALGINPLTRGYQNHFYAGMTNLSGQNYFGLTYTRPDPAPLGVSYTVDAANDLSMNTWTDATITINTVNNGDGTATVTAHDNTSTSNRLTRFFRLLVTGVL